MKIPSIKTKNLFITLLILVFISLALFIMAFLYIDFSGHKSFVYKISLDGAYYGAIKVDRYSTEDKIIFKSASLYPYSFSYPVKNEILAIDKKTLMPLKYTVNMIGKKGAYESITLAQNSYTTDMVIANYPSFMTLRSFETGDRTSVFYPASPLLYMSLMEQYNFWRKGSQYFEIMVPISVLAPLLRDKVEVKHIDDDYVSIMGQKQDAEIFTVQSKAIPIARISLSKYGHDLLSMDIRSKNLSFELVKPDIFINELKTKKPVKGLEVFIDSGPTTLLAGELTIPNGSGPFGGVILIPEDGPISNGQYFLFNSLMEKLPEFNIAVLMFSSPGQGKSYGNFTEITDAKRIENINQAVKFLSENTSIDKENIALIGYKEGSYLALKASEFNKDIRSVIALGAPAYSLNQSISGKTLMEKADKIILKEGLATFDAGYMGTITSVIEKELLAVINSQDEFTYYLGKKLPLKSFKEYLERPYYETLLGSQKPLLLLFGKDDINFKDETIDYLKKQAEDNKNIKLVIARSFGEYMGSLVKRDNIWQYEINNDVINSIKNWILRIE